MSVDSRPIRMVPASAGSSPAMQFNSVLLPTPDSPVRATISPAATAKPRPLNTGRVAIARALVHGPALILADEPTGNLDPRTADEVLALLLERVREEHASALIVTHSQHVAQCCDRILTLTPDGLE